MGNNNIKLSSEKGYLKVFVGKNYLYKGELIPLSEAYKYVNKQGFRIIKHFGTFYKKGDLLIYSYSTSKNSYYVEKNLYSKIENWKCDEGLFSFFNYPIITNINTFKEFTEISYSENDFPLYVQEAYKKVSREEINKQSFLNFINAYENANTAYEVDYNKKNIITSAYPNKDNIMLASKLGILNVHNTGLLLKNKEISIEDLRTINTEIMDLRVKINITDWKQW